MTKFVVLAMFAIAWLLFWPSLANLAIHLLLHGDVIGILIIAAMLSTFAAMCVGRDWRRD